MIRGSIRRPFQLSANEVADAHGRERERAEEELKQTAASPTTGRAQVDGGNIWAERQSASAMNFLLCSVSIAAEFHSNSKQNIVHSFCSRRLFCSLHIPFTAFRLPVDQRHCRMTASAIADYVERLIPRSIALFCTFAKRSFAFNPLVSTEGIALAALIGYHLVSNG